METKAQVVRYKCCNEIFAACREPECYEDADWHKDIRKYSKQGHKVDFVPLSEFNFGKCKCKDVLDLFNPTP